MKQALIVYLPWVLSALTVYMTILQGNQRMKTAWIIALINSVLWSVWILMSANWGLLPMNIALWIVYIRNFIKLEKAT